MADKITQTNVLQITVQDTDSNRQSFNIENPVNSITIAQVRDIFAPIISSGKWYSRAGNPINYIEQATLTKTKKIELDDSGEAITVTPTEYTFNTTTPNEVTFTVTGSPIKGYKIIKTSGNENILEITGVKIDQLNNTIKVTTRLSGSSSGTCNYEMTITTVAGAITVNLQGIK